MKKKKEKIEEIPLASEEWEETNKEELELLRQRRIVCLCKTQGQEWCELHSNWG